MQVKTYEEYFGKPLTIRDLVNGFQEDTKSGSVTAYGGKLNVRPPYQREFIYEKKAQQAVISTIMNGYPLNVMYWAKCDDNTFEIMDGQQRTMSICKFHDVQQVVPVYENGKLRNLNLDEFDDKQTEAFLSYPLTVYICDGSEDEKLAWFRTINIAGVKLTEQEMRNAIYTSPWVTDAKKYFSNIKGEGWLSEGHNSNGYTYGEYINADGGSHSEKETSVVRQKLLEIVLSWAVDKYNQDNKLDKSNKINIDDYMRINKNKPNALELWRYYEDVMEWVKATFPTYQKDLMKKVEWGFLFNEFHNKTPNDADKKVNKILENKDELKNPKEVFRAVLSEDMKYLNPRAFSDKDKKWAYEKQNHQCPYCKREFEYKDMAGDHIKPWSKGGKTDRDNLQMLCTECNIKKSAHDVQYTPWENNNYNEFDLNEWDNQE